VTRRIGSVRDYYNAHPRAIDATLVLLLTACAAALRLTLLGDLPYGVHSDEAQLGTDAHKILAGHSIGIYTHAVLGQPAGHAWLTLPSIWALGDTAFALRLPLALVALAAIPLLYLLVRVALGRVEAFFAAALLTVSYWHLLYSRVAHWSVSYGTVLLAALLFLMLGMRARDRRWFLASGVTLGIGVYTYNIYPIAVAAFGAFAVIMTLMRYRHGDEWRWWRASVAIMAIAALLVALPMIVYVANPHSYYWAHIDNYSDVDVIRSAEYRQAGTWDRALIIGEQARTFAAAFAWRGVKDSVDGNGIRPMFAVPTLILMAFGLILALRRIREPMVLAAVCCVLIIPLPAVPQTGSIMREPLGAAPFAMFIAAMPLAAAWRWALRQRQPALGGAGVGAVAAVVVIIAAITVHDYFWTYRKDPWPRLIYFSQMTSASIYMRDLPADTQILFYSERASINLETRQFLAPNVHGQNRSVEFSSRAGSLAVDDRIRPAVFVLLGAYMPLIETLQERYPDGTSREFVRDNKVEFIAFELPVAPGATAVQPP
jgi:4-amino-4-deoxy-L-arabinose transferase-like glycosyltransferase